MHSAGRRAFLRTAGSAVVTTAFFPGRLHGAGDRPRIAFIGCGRRGRRNLDFAASAGGMEIAGVCDLDRLALQRAEARVRRLSFLGAKAWRDFREVLADRSIDAVAIAAPAEWRAPMTIAACEAGKDVWCETPACLSVEEGVRMVEAARRYRRVVQVGAVERSSSHFQQVRDIVRSGDLGAIALCNAYQAGPAAPCGMARSQDVLYLIDTLQFAFDEAMPVSISAQGGRPAPQTLLATYRYPGFIGAYESRAAGPGCGIAFHGTRATLMVNREGYWIRPSESGRPPAAEAGLAPAAMHVGHWKNFIECLHTRRKPSGDIENCVRSTTTCLLTDLALRHGALEIQPLLQAKHFSPWKLEVSPE